MATSSPSSAVSSTKVMVVLIDVLPAGMVTVVFPVKSGLFIEPLFRVNENDRFEVTGVCVVKVMLMEFPSVT